MDTAVKERRFLSVGGAARELGKSPSSVRRYEQDGLLPPAQRVEGTRGVRFWPAEHIATLKARMEKGESAA